MPSTDKETLELETRLKDQISKAREARNRFEARYNSYYDLTAPTKKRIGEDSSDPRPANDQDDIFDATLEEVSENFAADMLDEFTPSYRPWTKHEPVSGVASTSAEKKIKEYISGRMDFLYDQIRQSSFEEAVQECYHDMGIGPAGLMIRYSSSGPIDCEYVPLAELLILPGPRGGVGWRAWERSPLEKDLHVIWPDIDWPKTLEKDPEQLRRSTQRIKIVECWDRDFEGEEEAWHYYLLVKGKIEFYNWQQGPGSCPLQVGRIRVSVPSAYGLGPASKAIPAARTLNRLAYLELKRLGKVVDPPGIFEDPEGIFNPDEGFEPGYLYQGGEGFKFHDMAPQNDIREGFFKREELEMAIRRALFQDKPFQRGLTPPSATQWIDESTDREKRKALPRARVHREWVLPIVRRFEWILEMRGELEELQINGQAIKIEPVSPLSRASDTQSAQVSIQALQALASVYQQQLPMATDMVATAQNIVSKLGDENIKFADSDQVQQMLMQALSSGQGAGTPTPGGGM